MFDLWRQVQDEIDQKKLITLSRIKQTKGDLCVKFEIRNYIVKSRSLEK